LLPNLPLLDQINSANNFDPLLPGRYAAWIQALEAASSATQQHMLDLMSVNVVEWEEAAQPYGVRFTPRQGYPQVRWSSCGFSVKDASQALEQVLMDQPVGPGRTILEAGNDSADLECSGDAQAEIQILRQNSQYLDVQVQTFQPGYLVVAEVWYPGWQATLDDKAIELVRADYLFRAVAVPAGKHQVTMSYRPATFYLGVSLSLLAWFLVGWIFWRGQITRNNS
jgi:hypothetical protein